MRHAVVALSTLLAIAHVARVEGEDIRRSVSVKAQTEIAVDPDEAIVFFRVVSEDRELRPAMEANGRTSRAVLRLTQDLGLTADNVRLIDLEMSPNYNQKQEQTGFTVRRTFEVRIHDFDKVDKLISGLVDAGVREVGNLIYGVKDQRRPLMEARRLAFTYAQEKASHLAELAKLRLGDVITVNEDLQFNPRGHTVEGLSAIKPMPLPQRSSIASSAEVNVDRDVPTRFAGFQAKTELRTDVTAGESATLVVPGKVRLSGTVSVVFELVKE